MKVLHLHTNWRLGGAAIACKRLHEAILAEGGDSYVLCQMAEGRGERIHLVPSRCPPLLRRVGKRLLDEVKRWQVDASVQVLSLNVVSNNLLGAVHGIRPDLVHLHWVGGGFLKVEDLPRLNVPIVWTLHDMWPFCGAEHVSYSDVRWKEGYTRANRPKEARGIDLNRWVWRRKQKAWEGQTIHTIGVSTWIDQCLRESALFRNIGGLRRVIPNGLDERVFRPLRERSERRQEKRFRVAFGAVRQSSLIKGGDLLLAALGKLTASGMDLELVTFGAGEISSLDGIAIQNRGQIADPRKLAELYNSVDLMIVPSRIESFGQTAAEAMACGTPVVCFDTSGLRDIVEHKKTGYRARCYDPEDLAKGVRWCLEDPTRLVQLGEQARERGAGRFSAAKIARETLEFYEEILNGE